MVPLWLGIVRLKMFEKSKLLLCLIYLCIIKNTESLKLVRIVVPPYKLRGEHAVLECQYELEGESLYAVKWYKENEEFFRYVPKSTPPYVSYKIDGVKVTIFNLFQHQNSGSHFVTLKALTLKSSGTYRCEVSAEAPFFSSAQKESRMEVVFLPKTGPQITGKKFEYQIGDELNLNCTSGKSYPPSVLKWFVNEKVVGDNNLIPYLPHTYSHGLATSVLGLKLYISSDHFSHDGSMKVRCIASVAPLLWQGDKESVLQKFDKREALLLVRNSIGTELKANFLHVLAIIVFFSIHTVYL